MRFTFSVLLVVLLFLGFSHTALAQEFLSPSEEEPTVATETADTASISAEQKEIEKLKKDDITKPEETRDKQEFVELFSRRHLNELTWYNFMEYAVQYAVRSGVPANTVILIFLLPFLATLIVFSRVILGFPSLEMWVSIVLAITLVSTGILAGAVLVTTILLASIIARMMLKKIRIMQMPKMALSVLIVSIFVFSSLLMSAGGGMLTVRQLSIYPILMLILLSEKIVTLQLTRSHRETFVTTLVTFILGIIGFGMLSSNTIRETVLLYPELILILIPVNILIGRYFGLRVTEMVRFSSLRDYGNK